MGVSLLHLNRLRQRRQTDQASANGQWQSSSLGAGFQRLQKDRQTRLTRNDRYCDKLDNMSTGTFRNRPGV